MKENKVRQPRRSIAKGDVVIPRMGVWADEKCLVLDVEKRLHAAGSYKVVRVLLPDGHHRWYSVAGIKEVIKGKGAIPKNPRQQVTDSRAANEKLYMLVVITPLAGTARENLERAKAEIDRVLNFRGSVTSVQAKGDRIITKFKINPDWDSPLSEKVELLKEWIPAKTRLIFKVHDVYLEDNQRRKG